MTKLRKRSVWSDDQMRMICRQTLVPCVSVGHVARRYDVNPNLFFAWLRDSRFADATASDVVRFLTVKFVAEAKAPVVAPVADDNHSAIELAAERRLRNVGEYEPKTLVRLIRDLTLYPISDQHEGLNALNAGPMRAFSDELNPGLFDAE